MHFSCWTNKTQWHPLTSCFVVIGKRVQLTFITDHFSGLMTCVDVKNIGAWIFFHLFFYLSSTWTSFNRLRQKINHCIIVTVLSAAFWSSVVGAFVKKTKNSISFSFIWPWYVSRIQAHTHLSYIFAAASLLAACLLLLSFSRSFPSMLVPACICMLVCVYTRLQLSQPLN